MQPFRLSLALAFTIVLPRASMATMPELSAMPAPPSPSACQTWAAKQDEEAVEMWGFMRGGGASRDVGLMRLALSCLGDEQPEIVGFDSSAGFNEQFCRRHPDWAICRKEAARDKGASACVVNDPTPTPMNYRSAPNGKVLGSIANGQAVSVMDTSLDPNGKRWAFISDAAGNTLGWAYQAYIRCGL